MTRTRLAARAGAVLSVAAVLIGGGTAAVVAAPSGPSSSSSATHHPLPTIVLVHGAWADGSSWSGEITRLQQQDYPVAVAPQPGRGPAADAAYLRSFLASITGPIVLVGHSYGGFVITEAATGNAQVTALVYVDAFVPDTGDSVASLTAGSGSVLEPALTDPTSVFRLTSYPGAPAGGGDSYVLPDVFRAGFAGDLPRAQATLLAATQTPFATPAFGEAATAPAWRTIPSWGVISRQDRVIPPTGERAMYARGHVRTTTIDGSHLSLVSHPDAVTRVIVAAANNR